MNADELFQKSLQLLSETQKHSEEQVDDDLDDFENWDNLDKKRQYELICKEVINGWSFPTIPIVNLMKHKFQFEYESANYQESALTLLQSQALSLRHQTLHQYFKRAVSNNEFSESTEMQQSIMAFHSKAEDNKQILKWIKELPKTWRIIQLSVDDDKMESRFKKTKADEAIQHNFPLKLVVIDCGSNYLTVHDIPKVPTRDKGPSLQYELQDILKLHKMMYKADNDDKIKYKDARDEVETRLKSLIDVMENKWLGFSKVLLLGKSIHDGELTKICDDIQKVHFSMDENFVSSGRRELLHKVLDGLKYLSENQLEDAVTKINSGQQNSELLRDIKRYSENLQTDIQENMIENSSSPPNRHPTVFILDKEIQGLPWESLECFQNQPISRVPSIHQLISLHFTQSQNDQSVPNTGVRQDKIFYVLNPDQNLAKTQERLEPTFASMSINEGIVGEQPSYPQMKKVLSEMDAFMYCGHGSSLKNFSSQEIEKLNARAVPLLFGCNSGKLERYGRKLDPMGLVNHYLIATAPCTLGFLWGVTDRDVDKWTVTLLKHWIEGKREFVQSVAEKRCEFDRMVNRAAVVLYGLPSLRYTVR